MKHLKILVLGILCLLLTLSGWAQIDCDKLPQKSSIPQAVNDQAGLLSSATIKKWEAELRQFESKTTIAIAFVSVKSIGDYPIDDYSRSLAQCWGIGHKGANNGLLVLIENDGGPRGKSDIEVGRGLEEYLTDGECGTLLRDVRSYFKAGNYDQGVDVLLTNITAKLGTQTWSEREEFKLRHAAAKKAESDAFWSNVLDWVVIIALILLICLLLFFFIKKMQELAEKRKQREFELKLHLEAKSRIAGFRAELEAGYKLVAELMKRESNVPIWAKLEMNTHKENCLETLDKVKDLLNAADAADKDAEEYVDLADSYLQKALQEFKNFYEGLGAKITKVEKQAHSAVTSITMELETLDRAIKRATKKGFRLEAIQTKYKDLSGKVNELTKQLTDPEQFLAIAKTSSQYQSQITANTEKVEYYESIYASTNKNIPLYTDRIALLRTLAVTRLEQLTKIGKLYGTGALPLRLAEFNASYVNEASNIYRTLEGKLEQARTCNSLESQQFSDAHALLEDVKSKLEKHEEVFAGIERTLQEQENKKNVVPSLLAELEKEKGRMLAALKDGDVRPSTKTSGKKAAQQAEALVMPGQGSVLDWIAFVLLIKTATDACKHANAQAKQDKSEAEAKRAEIAREAAVAARRKREREAEDEQRTGRNNESSFSSYSPSFSSDGSSGHNSGYSGFDGGSFGGGGGSDSW